MNWKFWKKATEAPKDTEKERLLRLRSLLLETSYRLRILDRVCSRYFTKATGDGVRVKTLLWNMSWDLDTYGKIWSEIAEIEEILHTKYHLDFIPHLEDLRVTLFDTNIKMAENHDRNLSIVRTGQLETDPTSHSAPC